ncbi:G-box-binding factor 4 isoform X1 [Pyrus x bretschneideri]|uniref:G-box-binding factor 4 isoform X1 n=1 Tax=Pyrus x bretschneideri TaxID=225117 RepID=UPI00202E9439|nr:G-box-binding factor 4 isoform X1 [Pyrus x bretschneideri]
MSSLSSRSRNSDLSRRPSSNFASATKPKPTTTTAHPSSSSAHPQSLNNYQNSNTSTTPALPIGSMTVDGLLYDSNPTPMTDATLFNAQITLLDSSAEINSSTAPPPKTVDEVWREIVSGECRKECKEEVPDEMMTLEDFLARAGAVEENDIKDFPLAPPPPETERLSSGVFSFDQIPLSPFGSIDKVEGSIVGFGNGPDPAGSGGGVGRRKRGRAVMEPMDKAAQQRQRRMIKNRESAARSRERKQAYQVELESLAVRLEEENEQLLKEQTGRTQARLKQLMENIIPVVEKRRPLRVLRRVRSLQW